MTDLDKANHYLKQYEELIHRINMDMLLGDDFLVMPQWFHKALAQGLEISRKIYAEESA